MEDISNENQSNPKDFYFEFMMRDNIPLLKSTIFRAVLLNRVIRQMYEHIINVIIIQRVIFRRKSDIPLFTAVQVNFMIEKSPDSDIKLSVIDEKRLFNVFLNYKFVGSWH